MHPLSIPTGCGAVATSARASRGTGGNVACGRDRYTWIVHPPIVGRRTRQHRDAFGSEPSRYLLLCPCRGSTKNNALSTGFAAPAKGGLRSSPQLQMGYIPSPHSGRRDAIKSDEDCAGRAWPEHPSGMPGCSQQCPRFAGHWWKGCICAGSIHMDRASSDSWASNASTSLRLR